MEVIAAQEKLKTDHPDYYKMHSRESYRKHGCLKTVCSNCGSTVSVRAIPRHKRTDKCMSYKTVCDDRLNVLIEELKPIMKLKGLTIYDLLDNDIN